MSPSHIGFKPVIFGFTNELIVIAIESVAVQPVVESVRVRIIVPVVPVPQFTVSVSLFTVEFESPIAFHTGVMFGLEGNEYRVVVFAQTVFRPSMVITGFLFTMTRTESIYEQVASTLIVTKYVVLDVGNAVGLSISLRFKLAAGDHTYDTPPEAVSIVLSPSQIVSILGDVLGLMNGSLSTGILLSKIDPPGFPAVAPRLEPKHFERGLISFPESPPVNIGVNLVPKAKGESKNAPPPPPPPGP